MADRESAVCWNVTRAEARSAECGAKRRAREHEIACNPRFKHACEYGLACRICGKRELAASDRVSAEDVGGSGEIVVCSARASRDDALRNAQTSGLSVNLVGQAERTRTESELCLSRLLRLAENVGGVLVELAHREGVRRMERERDHRLDGRKIDIDRAVIVRKLSRLKLPVCLGTSVTHEVALGLLIRDPDR